MLLEKIRSNNRLWSILDQGFISASNFIISILVVRFLGLEIFGYYIIVYGGIALMLRLHAAYICMPMVTHLAQTNDEIEKTKYMILHLFFLISQIVIAPLILYLFFVLFIKIPLDSNIFISYTLAMISLLTQEFVRRYMISVGKLKIATAFSFTYVFLVALVIMLIPHNYVALDAFFYSFSIAAIPAFIFYIKNIIGFRMKNVFQVVKYIYLDVNKSTPLIYNNVMQWFSGQYIHYVLIFFTGASAVGLLAAVRNIFGPVNVLLLSLEGFLPRKFVEVYKRNKISALRIEILQEIKIIIIGFFILGIVLQIGGVELFHFMYDAESDFIYMIMMLFLVVYAAAFLWRVIMIGLRAIDEIKIVGSASIISLCCLIVISLFLVPKYGAIGGVISMAFGELITLVILVISLNNKFRNLTYFK